MNRKIVRCPLFVKKQHQLVPNRKNGKGSESITCIKVNNGSKCWYYPNTFFFKSYDFVQHNNNRSIKKCGELLKVKVLKKGVERNKCDQAKEDNYFIKSSVSTKKGNDSYIWRHYINTSKNKLFFLQQKCCHSSKSTKQLAHGNSTNSDEIEDLKNVKILTYNKKEKIVPFYEMLKTNWKSYILLSRMHIPTGIYLLFFTSLYAYILTYDVNQLLLHDNSININKLNEIIKTVGLLLFGSINTRVAGCIANDMWDKDFDKHVERTKARPLANGTMSVKKALMYFCLHGTLSLWTLCQFNYQTIGIGLGSIFFIISYPLMKRITFYAQVYLSLTFNLGFFIASSINTDIFHNPFPFLIGFLPLSFLTIIYDTIYAHQDKHFDKQMNLKSMALKWGERTLIYSKILALGMIPLFYWVGILFDMHNSFFLLSVCNVLYLYHLINKTSLDGHEKCMNFFKNNKNVVFLMAFSAFVAKTMELLQIRNKNREEAQAKSDSQGKLQPDSHHESVQ